MANENKYLNYPGLSYYNEKVMAAIDQKISDQAIKYTTEQGLTAEQQAQARANIGAGTGTGSVTSVGLENANNGGIVVTGSPITTSGTMTIGLQEGYGDTKNPYGSKNQNLVLATPNGSQGAPVFRGLVSNDIPNLDASKITTGTFNTARIPDLSGTYITRNTLIAKGDIIYASAAGTPTVLTAGNDGKFLTLSNGVPVWGDTTSANDGVLTLKAGNNTKTFSANQSTNETFEVTAADLGINGAMEFAGISSTDPQVSGATVTGHTTWKKGEVVLYKRTGENGYEEYINLDGNNTAASWEILGDADSYALNSITIEGTGVLGGGGDLSSNRTITHDEVLGTAETTAKVFKTAIDKYGHISSATAATAADLGVSLTTTTGSEATTVGSNSLNVVTRDTVQTISANKTITGEITVNNATGGRLYSIYDDGQSDAIVTRFGPLSIQKTVGSDTYTFSFPSANGTLALYSQIPTEFAISANSTDGLFDITGTGGNNAVSYSFAPYSSKQTTSSFYSGNTDPTLTTRLNYDGYLYATKLYSAGGEVALKTDIPSAQTVTLSDASAGSGTSTYQNTTWGVDSTSVSFYSISEAEIGNLFNPPSNN